MRAMRPQRRPLVRCTQFGVGRGVGGHTELPETLGTGDLEFPRGVDGEHDNSEVSDSVKLSSNSRL